jgi:hypothetical protein
MADQDVNTKQPTTAGRANRVRKKAEVTLMETNYLTAQ